MVRNRRHGRPVSLPGVAGMKCPEEIERRIEKDSAADNLAGGPCPFCKGHLAFPRDLRGGEGYVMHTDPPCSTYCEAASSGHFMAAAALAKIAGRQ